MKKINKNLFPDNQINPLIDIPFIYFLVFFVLPEELDIHVLLLFGSRFSGKTYAKVYESLWNYTRGVMVNPYVSYWTIMNTKTETKTKIMREWEKQISKSNDIWKGSGKQFKTYTSNEKVSVERIHNGYFQEIQMTGLDKASGLGTTPKIGKKGEVGAFIGVHLEEIISTKLKYTFDFQKQNQMYEDIKHMTDTAIRDIGKKGTEGLNFREDWTYNSWNKYEKKVALGIEIIANAYGWEDVDEDNEEAIKILETKGWLIGYDKSTKTLALMTGVGLLWQYNNFLKLLGKKPALTDIVYQRILLAKENDYEYYLNNYLGIPTASGSFPLAKLLNTYKNNNLNLREHKKVKIFTDQTGGTSFTGIVLISYDPKTLETYIKNGIQIKPKTATDTKTIIKQIFDTCDRWDKKYTISLNHSKSQTTPITITNGGYKIDLFCDPSEPTFNSDLIGMKNEIEKIYQSYDYFYWINVPKIPRKLRDPLYKKDHRKSDYINKWIDLKDNHLGNIRKLIAYGIWKFDKDAKEVVIALSRLAYENGKWIIPEAVADVVDALIYVYVKNKKKYDKILEHQEDRIDFNEKW